MQIGHVHQKRWLPRLVNQRLALVRQGLVHLAPGHFELRCCVVGRCGVAVGHAAPGTRFVFQVRDVAAVHSPVPDHPSFYFAIARRQRACFRWRLQGKGRRRIGSNHSTFLYVIHNRFRQR